MAIKSPSDCITLRQGCQLFVKWCNDMGLVINGDKSKIMTISRARSRIHFDYFVNTTKIERVKQFKDLRVIFNKRFDFINDDLAFRTVKARLVLGLIMRQSSGFRNPTVLKTLFLALVRSRVSRVEYCNPIWNPIYQGVSIN